jgi:type II secretory pathway pseudopilin PulG
MERLTPISERRASERGFTLAGLIVIMTIIMIIVAYTVPRQWSMVMARERDRQTIYAMKQYARAIREFQKKNNVLPSGLKQLKDARTPRFVRGFTGFINDPKSNEPDWILLPVGTPPGNQTLAGPGGGSPPTQPPTASTGSSDSQNPSGMKTTVKPGDQQLIGGFVGVRPNRTGPSFLALNDKEN